MHAPTLRVLGILRLAGSRRDGLRLSEFSALLEIPKSTLVPILQTLCQQRFLHLTPSGHYTAGTALFTLGAELSGAFPVLEYLRSELESMVQTLGETCYCGALEEGTVLYLEKVDSPQPLRMLTGTGKRLPAYATSLGKALLLDKSREELLALYGSDLQPLTPNTLTTVTALSRQLAQAREWGYTWEIEESTDHIRCFAAPIRKHGTIVAAVSVAIPLFRYEESNKETYLATLKRHAARIGQTLEKTDAHFGELF